MVGDGGEGGGDPAPAAGRRRLVTVDAIREAGLAIGLADLTVSTVAARLGVTRAAVYKHVPSRWDLEELVGEEILAGTAPPSDRGQSAAAYLEEVAGWLRALCLAHPGLAEYMAALYPRSARSARLTEAVAAALVERGLTPAAAVLAGSTVANHAVALVRSEVVSVRHVAAMDDHAGYVRRIEAVFDELPVLGAAWPRLRGMSFDEHFTWCMRCTITGVLSEIPGHPRL